MELFCKLVGEVTGKTIAIDGKAICSTANMNGFENPLHISVLKVYRDKYEPKSSMTSITRKCLHDTDKLLDILKKFSNC